MISDSVELCETDVCFLHIQLNWNKRMTSKNAQCSARSRFRISKISREVRVWKPSQPALFGSVSQLTNTVCIHMHDECRRSNDIIVCHKLWSISWSIVQACSPTIEYQVVQYVPIQVFQNNLRAYSWQFSYRFQFFFFEVVVIDAWSRYFVELVSRPVCQLTVSFHTFHGMTFHIVRHEKIRIFSEYGSFSVPPAQIRDSNMVL